MKPAIIFDFDYTLADSSKGAFECINYALRSMGEAPQSWDNCCATIGLSLPEVYKSLTGNNSPENTSVFYHLFIERANQVMASSTELYDGVNHLICRLASSGFVLGIVSTKFRYRICQILDRYDLTDQFAAIVGGEDVEKYKPDSEGIRLFLSMTSMTSQQAVFVGDSLTDAKTAVQGGLDFIAVLTGTTPVDQFAPYSPKAILDSVIDLEKYA